MAEKRCTKCGSKGPFYSDSRGGLKTVCVKCHLKQTSIYQEKRWRKNPKAMHDYGVKYRKKNSKRYALLNRESQLRCRYGTTLELWNALFDSQGRRCKICRTTKPGSKGWQTDHDHETKKIRGILCRQCNLGLGNFKDDPRLLRVAIGYLERL
jgi:hypothetical protein